MSGGDQAAGLRRWLEQGGGAQGAAAAEAPQQPQRTRLCVVGIDGPGSWRARWVQERLLAWHQAGSRWVGDPDCWEPVPVDVNSPQLVALARQENRWALWVASDLDAFRQGYRTLQQLAQCQGPRRLLALHPPGWSRKGLLANLEQAAASMGLRLVVLAR